MHLYGTAWHFEASWEGGMGPEWYKPGPCIAESKRRLWIGAWTLGLGGQKKGIEMECDTCLVWMHVRN
jgi:hypothetical protein